MSEQRKRNGTIRRGPDPARLAEFAATARRLQLERETSAHLVERLLRDTPVERWGELAEREELRNCGALERLGTIVGSVLASDPRHALAVAELAVAIVDSFDGDSYPAVVIAQLQAHALKDLGKALLYLGRFNDALAALDRADASLDQYGALAHDRAIVGVVRATTLHEMSRFEEAFTLLATCKDVFRSHHDEKRLLMCGVSEGVLLHRMRRYHEARETYLLLLASNAASADRETLASLYNVIGHCSVDLADFDAAETHLSRAIELFHALGQPLQAAKAELGRGRMMIRQGEWNRGIAHLSPIRADFLRHDMVEEAGLCGLEIVEALILRGAARDAEALARRIVAEFTAAELNARAISALGYLSEAIAARKASTETVATVREYIVSLRTSPEREFVVTN